LFFASFLPCFFINFHWVSCVFQCLLKQRPPSCSDSRQHTAAHCNTLQQIAAHCNTLQHTATHCICVTCLTFHFTGSACSGPQNCSTLQHTATHCNTLHMCDMPHISQAAHAVGLKTTSTLMFGHVEAPGAIARHLVRLRALQRRSKGITEFVPLPFVHNQAPMYLKGESRQVGCGVV